MPFTITDQEFTESKQQQESVYSIEGDRQAGRSYLDPLGHARWDTDYYTLRVSGYDHQAALAEMRCRIREAWTPPLPAQEPHPPVPPPPGGGGGGGTTPAAGLKLGPGLQRVANPSSGRLPLPAYGDAVVKSVFAAFPSYVGNCCQSHGGSWDLMNWIVDVLRTHDTRWGFNGKRGNASDPSHDAITYNFSADPDMHTTNVYIIDVVGGHCGPNPGPSWNNVTQITIDSGSIGRWISRGRF